MKKYFFLLNFLFIQFLFANTLSLSEKFLIRFDINADKKISKDEFKKIVESNYKKMDTNNDGKVNKKEFIDFVCFNSCDFGTCECLEYENKEDIHYLKEYWNSTDKNNDGIVTFEESYNKEEESFISFDINMDGIITHREIKNAFDEK